MFGTLRPFRLPLLVISAAVTAALVLLFCCEPRGQFFYPTCLFHSVTGLLCPGCGSLRALHQLLHGHVLAAFRFNALLMVGLPALAWYGLGGWHRQVAPQPDTSDRQAFLWLFLGAALLFSILRNLPGPWFAWLRPG